MNFNSPKIQAKFAIGLYITFAWSWLFMSRVSSLTNSEITGYLSAVFVFLVIGGMHYFILNKFAMHLLDQYKKATKITPIFIIKYFFVGCLIEFLLSVSVAVVWLGKDGSIDSVFAFTSFTPLLMHTPIRFLSTITGFHGLSLLFLTLLLVLIGKKSRHLFAPLAIGVLVLTLASWLYFRSPTGTEINVAILAESDETTTPINTSNLDLAVYPEYGFDDQEIPQQLANVEEEVFFVGSKQIYTDYIRKNMLTFGSSKAGATESRAKSRLIPGGEYIPYSMNAVLSLTGADKAIDYFNATKATTKAEHNFSPIHIRDKVRLGSAICSSIIAPGDYRKLTRNGATILTNSSSLGIFDSPIFTAQQSGFAKFMATANARPFVESSINTHAFALNHQGNLIADIDPAQSKNVIIKTNTKTTPYTVFGEWTVWVGVIYVFAYIIRVRIIGKLNARQKSKSSAKPATSE